MTIISIAIATPHIIQAKIITITTTTNNENNNNNNLVVAKTGVYKTGVRNRNTNSLPIPTTRCQIRQNENVAPQPTNHDDVGPTRASYPRSINRTSISSPHNRTMTTPKRD